MENRSLALEKKRMGRETKELVSELKEKKKEIMRLQAESDELKTRLSKLASDRLTDNNPDITDLADENRAVKVGEKFSELYSNEWSDAFEVLVSEDKMTEKEAIKYLLDKILDIFDICKKTARQQLQSLENAIMVFTGNKKINPVLIRSLKIYKDERKKQYKNTAPTLDEISCGASTGRGTSAVNTYVEAATRICWLMCIQDPPMVLSTIKKGKQFDGKYFSAYTSSGTRVAYLVWPALLLCNDGAIVQKGVVQGRNKKKNKNKVNTNNMLETTNAVNTDNTFITSVHS